MDILEWMAKKKAVSEWRPVTMVRNIHGPTYEAFKKWCEKKGWKLGPTLSAALREKMERDKQQTPPS